MLPSANPKENLYFKSKCCFHFFKSREMFEIKIITWNSETELLFIIKVKRMGGAFFKIYSKC